MFGIDLIDASLLPAITVALVAGIISFLSPCVLPIVPPYLAYMSGVSLNDMSSERQARRRLVVFGPLRGFRIELIKGRPGGLPFFVNAFR